MKTLLLAIEFYKAFAKQNLSQKSIIAISYEVRFINDRESLEIVGVTSSFNLVMILFAIAECA